MSASSAIALECRNVTVAVPGRQLVRDLTFELRAGSITELKIYLNGKEVFARETYHQGMTSDAHIAPCVLKAGRNEILIKVCQNDQKEPWAQDWQFHLRITDPTGAVVPVAVVPLQLPKDGEKKP